MKILKKDSGGNWNTTPSISVDRLSQVNCHKFVLFQIGKISWEEMISESQVQRERGEDFTFGEKARSISNIEFVPITDLSSLQRFADESCEVGKNYVGQIMDAKTNEIAHSFIVSREINRYLCFNKPGFKYPFEVCELKNILYFVNKDGEESNKNQLWRFVPAEI